MKPKNSELKNKRADHDKVKKKIDKVNIGSEYQFFR